MRKERIIDLGVQPSVQTVTPYVHIMVSEKGVASLICDNIPDRVNEGVSVVDFSLERVLANGGALTPSPKVQGSAMATRDNVEQVVANVELEQQTAKAKAKFKKDYEEFLHGVVPSSTSSIN